MLRGSRATRRMSSIGAGRCFSSQPNAVAGGSMTGKIEEVRGRQVVIRFDGGRCIHSRNCVLGRPDVFVPNVEGEWIHPDAGTSEEVMALAANCPSGAIETIRHAGDQEKAPKVNLVRVRENGPLALHGELVLRGEKLGFRATLCRCGNSANKPF